MPLAFFSADRLLSWWTITILLLVAIFVVSFPTDFLTTPTGKKGAINSFSNFTWGTSLATVQETYKVPKSASTDTTPVFPRRSTPGRAISYNPIDQNGDTASVTFIFHPDLGLVKGIYRLRFGRGSDCVRVFNKYENRLSNRFSSLEKRTDKYNNLRVSFCNAALVGEAGRVTNWSDTAGNRITLVVGTQTSKRRVSILYESSAFLDWEARTRAAYGWLGFLKNEVSQLSRSFRHLF